MRTRKYAAIAHRHAAVRYMAVDACSDHAFVAFSVPAGTISFVLLIAPSFVYDPAFHRKSKQHFIRFGTVEACPVELSPCADQKILDDASA